MIEHLVWTSALLFSSMSTSNSFPLHVGTNGKRKKDDESSESEEEETEDKTPKNKKAKTTPQTFPKASKKVSPARDWNLLLNLSCQ